MTIIHGDIIYIFMKLSRFPCLPLPSIERCESERLIVSGGDSEPEGDRAFIADAEEPPILAGGHTDFLHSPFISGEGSAIEQYMDIMGDGPIEGDVFIAEAEDIELAEREKPVFQAVDDTVEGDAGPRDNAVSVIEDHFPAAHIVAFDIDVAFVCVFDGVIERAFDAAILLAVHEGEVIIEHEVVVCTWGGLTRAWGRATMISRDTD